MRSAFIFDFDNTIAATDGWAELRRTAGYDFTGSAWRRYFHEVSEAEHIVRCNEPVGDVVYRALMSSVPTAIVTTSPREAPIGWFRKRYSIEPPVVIGFQDTRRHKPDPQPLEVALRALEVTASPDVVSVGDDWRDVLAAHRAGISSASFEEVSHLAASPDIWFDQEGGTANPAFLVTHSPHSERAFAAREYDKDTYVGGRYHVDGGEVHDLILASKTGTWPNPLVDAATRLVAQAVFHGREMQHVLTTIPPHDGSDRFTALRTEVAGRLGIESSELLEWQRNVGSLRAKGLGADGRRRAVRGALRCSPVGGVSVVVLDDVFTTGATTGEAGRAIAAAGGFPTSVALVGTLSTSSNVNLDKGPWGDLELLPRLDEIPRLIAEQKKKLLQLEAERREAAVKAAKEKAEAEEAGRTRAKAASRIRAEEREVERQRKERAKAGRRARKAADAERAKRARVRQRNEELVQRTVRVLLARGRLSRIEAEAWAHFGLLPLLPQGGGQLVAESIYQRDGTLWIGGRSLSKANAASDAADWIRAGRPDDTLAFAKTDPDLRLGLLRILQHLDL